MYHKDADIILVPYNYLLSQSYREKMDIDLNKSIIIIDEAHNIMQAAESVIDTEISHS